MKKYDLLKVLGIVFLAFVVLSWIIPVGSYAEGAFTLAKTAPMGLFDLIRVPLVAFSNYIVYGVIFLLIGGLYGVMNQTGAYTKLLESIVLKFKGKEKRFLILSIVLFAVLASFTGLNVALFVIVPLFISAILLMGYDKITAMMSTVGAILVGAIGSTYGFNVSGYINYYLGMDVNTQIWMKLILLVIVIVLFVLYVTNSKRLSKIEKIVAKKEEKKDTKKSKKTDKTEKVVKAEPVKEDKISIPLYEKNDGKKKSVWPLVILLSVVFVFLLVAMYNWRYGFEIKLFEDVYEAMIGFEVKGYPIFKNILGSLSPLGYWSINELGIMLGILTLAIGWLYNVKMKDMLDGFVKGAKEMLPVAFYVTLANVIMAVVVNSQTTGNLFLTVSDFLLNMTEGFNFLTTSLVAAIGSLFYNDFPYLLNSVVGTMTTRFTDSSIYPIVGLIFQAFHGLVMLIVPTSIILVAGLSYLKVSYKEYFMYAWKFLLQLFVAIVAVILVMFMFI